MTRPIIRLTTTHLHVDDRAEHRTAGLIQQRQLDTDANRRVRRRDREVEIVGGVLVASERTATAHQMVARVVELGGQRVRHRRAADLSVDHRSEAGGAVRSAEVDAHLGLRALENVAHGGGAAGDAHLRRERTAVGACGSLAFCDMLSYINRYFRSISLVD